MTPVILPQKLVLYRCIHPLSHPPRPRVPPDRHACTQTSTAAWWPACVHAKRCPLAKESEAALCTGTESFLKGVTK